MAQKIRLLVTTVEYTKHILDFEFGSTNEIRYGINRKDFFKIYSDNENKFICNENVLKVDFNCPNCVTIMNFDDYKNMPTENNIDRMGCINCGGSFIYDDTNELFEDIINRNIANKAIKLNEYLKEEESSESYQFKKAIRILDNCGAIDYAKQKAHEYIEKAKSFIEELDVKDKDAKNDLIELAEFFVKREY